MPCLRCIPKEGLRVTEHIKTRKKLTDITTLSEFQQILDLVILTPEEKKIMTMHYIDGISLMEIGYELGYAEITVCRKHQKILRKISKVLS